MRIRLKSFPRHFFRTILAEWLLLHLGSLREVTCQQYYQFSVLSDCKLNIVFRDIHSSLLFRSCSNIAGLLFEVEVIEADCTDACLMNISFYKVLKYIIAECWNYRFLSCFVFTWYAKSAFAWLCNQKGSRTWPIWHC